MRTVNKEFMKEMQKIMWKQIKDIAEKIERKENDRKQRRK